VTCLAYILAITGFISRTRWEAPPLSSLGSGWVPYAVVLAVIPTILAVRSAAGSRSRVAFGALAWFMIVTALTQHSIASVTWLDPAAEPLVQAKQSPIRPVHGIIVVTMDTTRRDRLSMYAPSAKNLTPSLQRFAENATVFDNAYACAPYTLSSHASLFTGRLPSEHGARPAMTRNQVRRFDRPLDGRFPTMAEGLAALGYQTAGIAANTGYLAKWTGLNRGFGAYAVSARQQNGYYPLAFPVLGRISHLKIGVYFETWPADDVTDAAIRWLKQNDSQPYFLFLNYMDVHEYMQRSLDWRPSRCKESPVDCQHYYDEQVQALDAELGRLLRWVADRETFDRTLIVITSDHGESLGERGAWGHGAELYEEVLRIPLMVKFPGNSATVRTPLRINHAQLNSLVLQAAQGKSLPEMSFGAARGPQIVAETWSSPKRPHLPWKVSRAVYGDGWKLIERIGGPSELFDLAKDPEEKVDLFKSNSEFATRLTAELAKTLPPLRADDPKIPDAIALTPEDAERLRALGYVDQ
jgi:arylsulfatase A-like enzyme